MTDASSEIIGGGVGLSVTGDGGGAGNSAFSSGIAILGGGQIIWGGNAELGTETIQGTGGTGEGGGNDGLLIDGAGSGIVFNTDLNSNTDIQGDSGQPGSAAGYGIAMTNGAEIDGEIESASLDLYLHADTMLVDATSTLSSPGNLVDVFLSGSGTIAGNVSSAFFGKDGAGTLTLVADGGLALGQLDVNAGTVVFADSPWLSLAGQSVSFGQGHGTLTLGAGSSVPFVSLYQGTLDGSNPKGNAGIIQSNGGTISPGNAATAGIIGVSRFMLDPTSTVVFKIGGESSNGQQPIAGIDYDQIQIITTTNQDTVVPNNDQPNVYLNHAVLDLVSFGNAAPEPGSVYTLISNPAGGPVLGVFKYQDQNLNEGGTVTIDGMPFVISYHGGAANNNDVILYNVANTSTTVASLTGGSTYGQMVTLEAHVAGVQTTLTPTGVVNFSIGDGTLIGSATLDADGNAILSNATLPAGSTTVTAQYDGANNFIASTNSVDQEVAQASPLVELATSQPTTALGQVVTFTGSVLPSTPGGLVPTGTATFYDETTLTTLAAGIPLVNGRAVLSLSTLGVGSHTVQFTYDTGDSNYNANTEGATATQTVAQASTATSFTSTSATSTSGQTVLFTIAVAAIAPGIGVPTGQVTITDTDTGAIYGPFALVNGMAFWAASNLGAGTHNLSAVYQPQGPEFGGSSASASVVVTATSSNIQLMIPTIAYTQSSVTLSAIVGGLGGAVTGSVAFYDNGVLVGTAPVNANGLAALSVTDLSSGNNVFTATYTDASGGSHGSSTSGPGTISVVPNPLTPVTAATTITITPIYLPPPSTVPASLGGRNTRLRFAVGMVNPIPGIPMPTGTVTVYADGKPIGTYNLDSQGTVTIVLYGKVAFNRTIVVKYNGGIQGITTYAPSSSAPFVADRAYFYGNSPSGGGTGNVKTGAHPAGPAKYSHAGHKAKVSTPALHGSGHAFRIRIPSHVARP